MASGARGESTWLGFFLYDILTHFATIAGLREGDGKKTFYLDRAAELRKALAAMWRDGQRYVRAITDSGEEMVFNDALNASWPVISGAADFDRGACAVEQGLKDLEQENLVLLLSPAFTESSRPNPGKLADYPPGVRENGGQYSHGASWLVDALVKLSELSRSAGDESRAGQYLARALKVWIKISPLDDISPERIDRYGLPPHQQPADVYYGYWLRRPRGMELVHWCGSPHAFYRIQNPWPYHAKRKPCHPGYAFSTKGNAHREAPGL